MVATLPERSSGAAHRERSDLLPLASARTTWLFRVCKCTCKESLDGICSWSHHERVDQVAVKVRSCTTWPCSCCLLHSEIGALSQPRGWRRGSDLRQPLRRISGASVYSIGDPRLATRMRTGRDTMFRADQKHARTRLTTASQRTPSPGLGAKNHWGCHKQSCCNEPWNASM